MRLIATFSDSQEAQEISSYLFKNGIENRLEISHNADWNSEKYGESSYTLWVIEEDTVGMTKELLANFKKKEKPVSEHSRLPPPPVTMMPKKEQRKLPRKIPFGKVTLGFFGLCLLLFLATEVFAPSYKEIPSYLPKEPFRTSAISKKLLFDYPQSYTLIDQVVDAYGRSTLLHPQDLAPEALTLLQLGVRTPVWQGAYDLIIQKAQHQSPSSDTPAPLFEKIRQGELWRLWTPCFLHGDLLHLFFNMIWLVVIGSQLELKLGPKRYILFFLLTAPLSNAAQYLMSGYNFLGFSGVLCAQLAFMWTRIKKAPWEGYQIEKGAFVSVAAFVLGMFALQMVAFLAQVFFGSTFSLPIANTAHLAGAFLGYILGKSRYFASLI